MAKDVLNNVRILWFFLSKILSAYIHLYVLTFENHNDIMMITQLLSTTHAVLIYEIQSNLESGQTSHNSLNLYNIVYTSTASEGEPYLCLLGFTYLQRV